MLQPAKLLVWPLRYAMAVSFTHFILLCGLFLPILMKVYQSRPGSQIFLRFIFGVDWRGIKIP